MRFGKSNIRKSSITTGMANSKTGVQNAPDYVSKPLPFEDRAYLEKSIKAATLREQIAQLT